MGSPARDADRWWASLSDRRREQIHRMMSPDAREEPVPEEQLTLDAAGSGR